MEAAHVPIRTGGCRTVMVSQNLEFDAIYYKLEKVFGVPQLFIEMSGAEIELLVGKVTDSFLVDGTTI